MFIWILTTEANTHDDAGRLVDTVDETVDGVDGKSFDVWVDGKEETVDG